MKTMCPPAYHHNDFMVYGNSCTWAHDVHDVTVHHVPKCMSCHKGIVVITERAHCFHDYIYIKPVLLL